MLFKRDNIYCKINFMIKIIVDCHNSPCQEENSRFKRKSGRSNANFWTQLHFARECGGIFSGISFSIKLSGTLAPLRRRGGDVFAQPFIFCALATGKPLLLGMKISLWEVSFLFLTSKQTFKLILCDRRAPFLQLLNNAGFIIWCSPRKAFPSHVDDIKN